MGIDRDRRQQLILRTRTESAGEVADVVLRLWQSLAFQLNGIIGEGGFHSLYARSLYLTCMAFPWLAPSDAPGSADIWSDNLKICLEGQSASEANKASHMLLLTFTDIVASLIGESLTISILSSAWNGDDMPELDIDGKELPYG